MSMLTPAEAIGLSGQRLAARVQNAIDSIPPDEMVELIRSIRREAEERHLVYQRDGVDEIIRLLPCPITLRPDQLGYTHYVSQTLLNCLKRLPDLYFSVPELQELLRVTPVEELSLIHISEPTRLLSISYAVFCLKKKNTNLREKCDAKTKGQI